MPNPLHPRSPIHLNHEKLDCYRASIEFLCLANDVATKLPRGFGPCRTSYAAQRCPSR